MQRWQAIKKAKHSHQLWDFSSIYKIQHGLSFLSDIFLAIFNQSMNGAVMLFTTVKRIELRSIFPCLERWHRKGFWFFVLKKTLQVSFTELGGIELKNLLQLLFLLLYVDPPELHLEVADFGLATGTACS